MIALGFAAMTLFGALLVLVGATQAALAARLGLDLAGSGLLASALAAGLGAGVVGAGPLCDRLPRRPLLAGAAGLAALALGAADARLGAAGVAACLAAAGLGAGAVETLVNALLAERYAGRAARPLTAAHLGATLGAVAAPPLLGMVAADAFEPGFRALAGAFAGLAALGALLRLPAPDGGAGGSAAPGPAGPAAGGARAAARPLALLGAAAACYVGLETALTVFAPPYARAVLGTPAVRASAAISGFWLGLAGGRLLLLALPGRPGAGALAAAGAAGAALLGAVVGLRPAPLPVALIAVGLVLGAVFPLLMALAAERAPRARGTATGLVAGCGSLGGFAVPWLTGALGDAAGPSLALASLCAWAVLLALLGLAVRAAPPGPPPTR